MIQQSQFLSQARQISSVLTQQSNKKRVSVYFTYQSSPQGAIQQNLNVIRQQKEQKMRRRIFSPRRKLSFQQSGNKKKHSRLRIFQQQKRNRGQTINNQSILIEGRKSQNIMRFNTGDIQKSINNNNNEQQPIQLSHPTPMALHHTSCYQKSPIYLKQSIISGAQTIVDQLQDLVQNFSLQNPIKRKLLCMKNRQTKRTFLSNTVNNTVKNSIILAHNRITKLNRIDSDVVSYHYQPNPKYRSAVTIKATTTTNNRLYGALKLSNNNFSIITNGRQGYQNFEDKEDVQTPRYNKSTYRSLRKSFQPSITKKQNGDNHFQQQQQPQSVRKNSFLSIKNHVQVDRFYDQSSLQTPRLPIVTKKISYEVIDPLTNSLKKQKMEKKQLRKLSQITQVKRFVPQSRFRQPSAMIRSVNSLVSTSVFKLSQGIGNCVGFLKSELFLVFIIVVLSLSIFGMQLLQ